MSVLTEFPVLPLQRSMALASLRSPRSGCYIVQDVCEIHHALDTERLRQAWRQVVRRHAALQTCVRLSYDAGLLLEPAESTSIDWTVEDWSAAIPEAEHDAAIQRVLQNQFHRGFDFETGAPPYRFTVIRNRGDWWTIVWTCHHVLLDGRSFLLLWREWFARYDGKAVVYGDGAQRIQETKTSGEQYWRQALADLDDSASRFVDRLLPEGGLESASHEPGREIRILDAGESRKLKDFAADAGVTMSTLIYGAWAMVLARQGSRTDVLFGAARAGRPSANEEIGFFIHTAPLRLRIDPRAKLGDWLRDLRERWQQLKRHEETPLELDAAFDTLVNFDRLTVGETAASWWKNRSLRRFQRTSIPFTLAAYGGGERVRLELVYSRARYTAQFAASAADQLETLLRNFAGHEETQLRDLCWMSGARKEWLHAQSQGPVADTIPAHACANELFEECARLNPDGAAIDNFGATVTYRELNGRANRLAWFLRERGASPEDVVAVLMPRGAEAVTATLAVIKSGAACLPIDPAQPRERLRAMLDAVQPLLVLSAGTAAIDGAIDIRSLDLTRHSLANPPRTAGPDNTAYVIFTSGSTGTPKAVEVPHSALVNHSLAVAPLYGITSSDRRLQFASPGADVFFAEVFIYLSAGACLVCCLDPGPPTCEQFTRALATHRITISGMPASWWKEWMQAFEAADGGELPRTLRAMICGMERLDASALAQWRRVSKGRVRLFNAYGPAENSPTSLVYEFGTSPWEGDLWAPVGKPVANTRAYVLSTDGRMTPPGATGELYLGGRGLARGYRNADAENRARFVPDPFHAGEKLYRTGDLAFRLPDGNAVFLGRIDQQMKVRGHRIEPEEIESALQRHPAVREAAVAIGERGDLIAYCAPNAGSAELTLENLRAHCRQLLPGYMMPAQFALVEEMPRAPGGKIHRASLPRTPSVRLLPSASFRPPATPSEIEVARIWRDVLQAGRVGLDDNFFDLGGNSLASTRLITAISASFGVELTLPALLRTPVLCDLAKLCETSKPEMLQDADCIIPLQPRGAKTPILALCCTNEDLHAFRLLASHLPPSQPAFILNCRVHWPGPLETIECLADRARRLIDREFSSRPYILAGFCYAGVAAFEAARLLEDAASAPRRLILFDAFRPTTLTQPATLRKAFDLARFENAAAFWSPQQLRKALTFALQLIRRRWRARTDAMAVQSNAPAEAGSATLLEWLERSAAMYRPASISVPVLQFVSKDTGMTTRLFDDPRLAWRPLCEAGFEVRQSPGSHSTLFTGEHLPDLSASLAAALE